MSAWDWGVPAPLPAVGDETGEACEAGEPGADLGNTCGAEGDTAGNWDRRLLAQALDQLLLQAQTHCGDAPLRMVVDGSARHAVVLRIGFAHSLSAAAAHHLLGAADTQPGLASAVGGGLREPERIAQAHAGLLTGSTRQRQGTVLELVLPREPAVQGA